jgi:sarcosine oxidase
LGEAYAKPFRIFRQVLHWFDLKGDIVAFAPGKFPVFIWELQKSRQGIYGVPAIDGPGGGIKIATEQYDATVSPNAAPSVVSGAEIAAMYRDCVQPFFPAVSGCSVKTATCLYTVTPDAGFVIDRHPGSDRVMIASPCSGHGFKHSPAVGEILCDLALTGRSSFDLTPFRLARFSA